MADINDRVVVMGKVLTPATGVAGGGISGKSKNRH